MSLFLATLGIGLGGLLLMALPGVRRHGRAGHIRVHRHTTSRGGAAGPAKSGGPVAPHTANGLLRHLPEPHVVFSVLALFGALGNVLQHTFGFPLWVAACSAALIAGLLEWLIVAKLWRLTLKFSGEPTSPLATLVMDQAEAVTAFRNGKGIVSAVLDGRTVQLTAELVAREKTVTVRVGDRLVIQEVDPYRGRVRVSLR